MRKNVLLTIAVLLLGNALHAQTWSGIISSNRGIRWDQNAGLSTSTWPVSGETGPATPWQPPSRSTICSTLNTSNFSGMSSSNYVTPTALTSALSSCPKGQAVYLSAGNYYFAGFTQGTNGVTLRLDVNATVFFQTSGLLTMANGGNTINNATWSAGFAQGATSITLSSVAGLIAGQSIITLFQCQDGYSGVGACGTGSSADPGGPWACGIGGICVVTQGATTKQLQDVLVTSISGTGPYTVGISPGLYMPNWNSSATPFASGTVGNYGMGLEGGTIDCTNQTTASLCVNFNNAYDTWILGVRIIGAHNQQIGVSGKSLLVMSNYLDTIFTTNAAPENININTASDVLIMNNIGRFGGPIYSEGGASNIVEAYNYFRDGWSNSGNETFMGNVLVNHDPGESYFLWEGNQVASLQTDCVHGSHNLDTSFRNLIQANDPPYTKSSGIVARMEQCVSRGMSDVGNVIGGPTVSSYLNGSNPVFQVGTGTNGPTDTLTQTSALRWGNYDTITGAVRWCGNSSDPGWVAICGSTSEIPSGLTGAAAIFNNSVPSSTTLPASFFMSTTAHPSGGTGLSWWKVCLNYPTCTSTQTQPFPPVGPDVTGGGVVVGNTSDLYAGHANNIPAAIAWVNTPIDTTRQISYAITSSSYSSGNVTLTFGSSVLPTTLVGEFQISGGPCAGTYAGASAMNSSSATTVVFAAASNPGNCASGGTFLYPNIRQATSGGMFLSDGGAVSLSPSSQGFGSVNVGSSSSPVTFTLTNNSTSSATSISPSVPGSNFLVTNSGAGSCAAIGSLAPSSSCTFTVAFAPSTTGLLSATLSVFYSGGDGASPQTAALSGTGLSATPATAPPCAACVAGTAMTSGQAQTSGGN